MNEFAKPRKSLGQNFLQDPNLIRKIVASLSIKTSDCVVEIGPGRGALTELILDEAGTTHIIEFDRDLAAYWRERTAQKPSLTVHESDVLKFDFQTIIKTSESKLKVIGNLPYNISSPVLFHLMHYAEHIDSQVVMLQKEVVDRMAAESGSKQYGRLSVMLQYRYQIEKLFNVPPTAFYPPPKVDSAIARLVPREKIESPAHDLQDLEKVVKQAFSQRRKTLRNTLKPLLNAQQIETCEIDPGARAESIEVTEFVKLANKLTSLN